MRCTQGEIRSLEREDYMGEEGADNMENRRRIQRGRRRKCV